MISDVFNYATLQTTGFIFQWPNWFTHYELRPSDFQWSVAFPQTKHFWCWGPPFAQAQDTQHWRCSWVCQCFSRWCLTWPGMWSMDYPDMGQAGAAFLAQMFWIHSCGNQLWGWLVHATVWDKAQLMRQDLGSSAASLGGCFWHKNYRVFMCSLGRTSLKSKQMKQSKNNAYLRDNEKESF